MGTVKAIGAQAILIANYGIGRRRRRRPGSSTRTSPRATATSTGRSATRSTATATTARTGRPTATPVRARRRTRTTCCSTLSAMKAVDPTIKIGAVLTLPGNWPDGVVAPGDSADWNRTVLSIAGSADRLRDRALVPEARTARRHALQTPTAFPASWPSCARDRPVRRAERPERRHRDDRDRTPLRPDTQPGALFAADVYLTALENGVFTVDWWDTRNGMGTISTAPDGATDYGDGGMLSSGTCQRRVCEPPLNTPFPSYYAIQMLSKVALPGDTLVKCGVGQPAGRVHAARNANGDLASSWSTRTRQRLSGQPRLRGMARRAAPPLPSTPTATRPPRSRSAQQGTSATQVIQP